MRSREEGQEGEQEGDTCTCTHAPIHCMYPCSCDQECITGCGAVIHTCICTVYMYMYIHIHCTCMYMYHCSYSAMEFYLPTEV